MNYGSNVHTRSRRTHEPLNSNLISPQAQGWVREGTKEGEEEKRRRGEGGGGGGGG